MQLQICYQVKSSGAEYPSRKFSKLAQVGRVTILLLILIIKKWHSGYSPSHPAASETLWFDHLVLYFQSVCIEQGWHLCCCRILKWSVGKRVEFEHSFQKEKN